MVALRSRLERLLLNSLQVVVTDVVIVFHKSVDLLRAERIKVLAELSNVHDLCVLEVDGADDARVLNGLNLLLDVGGLLEDAALRVLELLDLFVALIDVLTDGQGEPVMVLSSLVHLTLELGDVLEEKFLLDGTQVAESRVVGAEELVEAIDVHHIVLLLEGDVDDRVRDLFANAVEELRLTDDHSEGRVEVDLVLAVALNFLSKDRESQLSEGFVRFDASPCLELVALILLSQLLSHVDVALGDLFTEGRACEDLRLGLKAVDGRLDPHDDGTSPGDGTRVRWHILRNRRVELVVLEQLSHGGELLLVLLEHVSVLTIKLSADLLASLDVVEVVEEIEGASG